MSNHTVTSDGWRSSSASQNNGGECVEWHPSYASSTGVVPIRDSKVPNGPVLMVSRAAFVGLVDLAKLG
ncbi:DUF397 domain-containing protein [Streptomyces sp. NBC_00059]|uniref:DUF397 domain-containing protein n=1 Tax=Streptomyces sp. NBC_00059 TaxID=2975635 RepID=UPI0022545273|nr:DUF397 domain-containing protein [Streptomyces sp. NBC_00059]MCX5412242.1 DUF397 domain-containing protein [Streptomyces sp. NBC_00059]